ncbi:hypothetical protein ILUMI_20088 [Ignelater luminosus]|uniref:CCHC-type domain-containing protein n=1 Tax=Ignelater luminosus TaxID=2038154 RepID=A0A8K0CEX0_IGNLU|nr:hypothetical protein ILUMI_20088 [Ignelater luminosus]
MVFETNLYLASAAGASDATYLTDLKKWESDYAEAMLYIMTTLDDETSTLVMTCTSAKEVWNSLISVFEQSSEQRLDRLLEKHFSKLNSVLKNQKKNELSDRILIAQILSTLGPHFREFRNVWEAMPNSDRTLENLVKKLRTIEQHGSAEVQKTAFLSQTQNKPKEVLVNGDIKQNLSLKSIKNVKCFRCKKKGHLSSTCPDKVGKKLHENVFKQKYSFVCSSTTSATNWIADTKARTHITFNKKYFIAYKPFVVSCPMHGFCNDSTSVALGQGNITVEVNIDENLVRTTLKNIWYVPGAIRNLFSISKSASKDHIFRADVKSCRLTFNREVSDSLQLWHERLGHQNKRHVKNTMSRYEVNLSGNEYCDGCVLGKAHRGPFRSRPDPPKDQEQS